MQSSSHVKLHAKPCPSEKAKRKISLVCLSPAKTGEPLDRKDYKPAALGVNDVTFIE
jgi:hypothetical protein